MIINLTDTKHESQCLLKNNFGGNQGDTLFSSDLSSIIH